MGELDGGDSGLACAPLSEGLRIRAQSLEELDVSRLERLGIPPLGLVLVEIHLTAYDTLS